MEKIQKQVINKDVKTTYDATDLVGKQIVGIYDDRFNLKHYGGSLTILVTEDKYVYLNALEERWDDISRITDVEDDLVYMAIDDFPDKKLLDFLIEFEVVNEEKLKLYRTNRKQESEREQRKDDYEEYLRLKREFEGE